MSKPNKLRLVLEITWLVCSLILLAVSIHSTLYKGFTSSIGVYSLTLLSLGMYFFRRQRRIQENNSR